MAHRPRQRIRLALLRAFARLARARASQPDSALSLAPRILVIRPDHLGDLLFITPALRALRRRYPDAHITLLIGPWGTPVLSHSPHVDKVVTLPFPGFTRQAKSHLLHPYKTLHRWAQGLRDQYELAFVLRFDHWWGALLAFLADVPHRVGYDVPEVTPLINHVVPYVADRHEVEQNLGLLDWDSADLGPPGQSRPTALPSTRSPSHHPLEFHIPEQVITWARRFLQSTRAIAIHPGAGAAIKLWKAKHWAAVADALADETHAEILLTGSEAERPLCREIAARMENSVRVMAGETTLDQLAALLGQCQLVLGPDSGPLHLAVATGTPTVHLYGPVDPTIFGPWGPPERHRVLVSAWPCIPCNRLDYAPDELAHHPCVREISVDAVLDAARLALGIYGEIASR